MVAAPPPSDPQASIDISTVSAIWYRDRTVVVRFADSGRFELQWARPEDAFDAYDVLADAKKRHAETGKSEVVDV